MNRIAKVFAIGLLALVGARAQQVTVDEKRDQIEALKIELDQAKQMRDKVIAKRWDNKQRDMDAREKFNQEYDDLKSKLDVKTQEADRLHADLVAVDDIKREDSPTHVLAAYDVADGKPGVAR